jgi:CheY-like chemotaxis protein
MMDGFETVRAIKLLPAYWNVPTAMLSSGDHHDDARRCREVGAQLYLRKPILRPRLHERLQKFFRKISVQADKAGVAPAAIPLAKKLHVLVAEDNIVNQMVACKMLERAGHTVECAVNGEVAVARYQNDRYDVILMDVQMPLLDGCQATRRIRQLEKNKGSHIAIVALTAHAMKGDREQCLQAGMDYYLSKPLRSHELHELLQQLHPAEAAAIS